MKHRTKMRLIDRVDDKMIDSMSNNCMQVDIKIFYLNNSVRKNHTRFRL